MLLGHLVVLGTSCGAVGLSTSCGGDFWARCCLARAPVVLERFSRTEVQLRLFSPNEDLDDIGTGVPTPKLSLARGRDFVLGTAFTKMDSQGFSPASLSADVRNGSDVSDGS